MSAREYATGPPELHAGWCRQLYASIRDGGVWAVPRAGMIFAKRNGRLELTEVMPGVSKHREAAELETIRVHFAAAGIEVVDARG